MLEFYLDEYRLIKVNNSYELLNKEIKVLENEKDTPFMIEKNKECLFIRLYKDYRENTKLTIKVEEKEYEVIFRFITHTKRFNDDYRVDLNTLGSFIRDNKTIFRLYSPLSYKAFVIMDEKESLMNYVGKGIFELIIDGNLEGKLYHYKTLREKEYEFKDPFSYVNKGNDSYVLDTSKFNYEVIKPKEKETVIYETSVRDFSSDNNLPFKYPKKLKAFVEEGLTLDGRKIGLDYLKELGISHLQFMPIFSFDLDGYKYNWGYNPKEYNTIEESYLVNEEPYKQVEEVREVVNALHKNDIKVNLDVVFNHVYKMPLFDLEKMVPYCFFRYKDEKPGNASLCGNETRSENYFLREYFKLLGKRFIKIYDIDGLRFDLMGIIDLVTINEIKDECKKIKPDFMVYGEGWNMGEILPVENKSIIENAKEMKDVGFFNNYFRETLRGKSIDDKDAYLLGNIELKEKVKDILTGSSSLGLDENQSINYIECHDNFTFFDKIIKQTNDINLTIRSCKLGLALTILSKGIPFIHSGQEFLRTKNGIDNTYNLDDSINSLDWHLKNKYQEVSDYLKYLIDLKNKYSEFSDKDIEIGFEEYYEVLIYKLGKLRIYINPCIFDHIYCGQEECDIIFDDTGFVQKRVKDFKINAYSLIVVKE